MPAYVAVTVWGWRGGEKGIVKKAGRVEPKKRSRQDAREGLVVCVRGRGGGGEGVKEITYAHI